jgi:hypothetical protein
MVNEDKTELFLFEASLEQARKVPMLMLDKVLFSFQA